MDFVGWVTAIGLLVVSMGGLYGGLAAISGRKVEFESFQVEGLGPLLLALLYFLGGVVALLAMAGLLLGVA